MRPAATTPNDSPASNPAAHARVTAWMGGVQGFLLFACLMSYLSGLAKAGCAPIPSGLSLLLSRLPMLLEVFILLVALYLVTRKARLDRLNGWGVLVLHATLYWAFISFVAPAGIYHLPARVGALAGRRSSTVQVAARSLSKALDGGSNDDYFNTAGWEQRLKSYWRTIVREVM